MRSGHALELFGAFIDGADVHELACQGVMAVVVTVVIRKPVGEDDCILLCHGSYG